ncbi:glycerophosphodiester phosphodiesterase family protein [Lapillicoccus sp.]|uniref:glycerophosphodiester phosphodiesterase family protein n=1 Tax=Lapillicoccus sp. TaxID=1909287 RepID=UPI0025EBA43E|nr:glycerophosphodiester phosphodiesterase family protein [Lapillicoccus sp.]
MSYGRETGPLAIAHRGGAALAPENTQAAFRLSAGLGLRYLETDVRVTRDGHLVCVHDRTLGRTTTDRGAVADRTLDQLRALHVGGHASVATLEEVLHDLPDACFTVDLKVRAAIAPMLDLLRRRDVAERVCVAGAPDAWLADVRGHVPAVTTALGWHALTGLVAAAWSGARPPTGVATGEFAHLPVRLVGPPAVARRLVTMAHDLHIRVVAWTVDDPARMRDLLDLGVDGIITDRPDLLREVLISRDAWRPAPRRRPTDAGTMAE